MHWRRKWQPTPVFLPGESQEQSILVGCLLWGRTEPDTTEVTQQQQQCICFHVIKLGFEAIAAGLQIHGLFILGAWGKRERSKKYIQRSKCVLAGEFRNPLLFFSFILIYLLYHH